MCSSLDESGLNGGLVLTPLLVSQHVEDTQGTHQTADLLMEEVGSSATMETLWKWVYNHACICYMETNNSCHYYYLVTRTFHVGFIASFGCCPEMDT